MMARCEQGYLCDVCGDEVHDVTESDLYLRFVTGAIDSTALLSARERHIRCNPIDAQFIVDPRFEPVVVEGPFAKQNLDATDVHRREDLLTRGWRRLQELPQLGLPVSEYPLPEVLTARQATRRVR
jgi:hypothetical protein